MPRLTAAELRERAARLLETEIGFIHHGSFTQPGASTEILGGPADMPDDDGPTPRGTPDGAPAYFASLYAVPLLGFEQEAALFRRMNYLKFRANQLRAGLNPSRPRAAIVEEIERLLSTAGQHRERIVAANLRLVVSIARRFAGESADFEELVSDGNLTLLSAVEKFDYSRGFRFSTYATHAIQRDFFRQIRKRRTDRARFVQASDESVAAVEDRESTLASQVEQLRRSRQLTTLMERELTDRERFIVTRRYGLDHDAGKQTLATIGAELGVSKERVRQLEIQAIEALQLASGRELSD